MKSNLFFYLSILFCVSTVSFGISGGLPHFYAPASKFPVPRLDRTQLSSIDIQLIDASANHSYTTHHTKAPLFEFLSDGSKKPPICGHFLLTEMDINWTQNLSCSFFIEATIPILSISSQPTPIQTFAGCSPQALCAWNKAGVGDITFGIGWSHSFIHYKRADFIDLCIALDILLPTAPRATPAIPFSIPLGYNGHPGLIGKISGDIGFFDWLTLGFFGDAICFFNAHNQHQGPLVWTGFFCIADHFARGLSLGIAYSFAQQFSSKKYPACPQPQTICTQSMANIQLCGWNMHVFHCFIEHDFSSHESCIGKRIQLGYQTPIRGKRIFIARPFTITIGIDIDWL